MRPPERLILLARAEIAEVGQRLLIANLPQWIFWSLSRFIGWAQIGRGRIDGLPVADS